MQTKDPPMNRRGAKDAEKTAPGQAGYYSLIGDWLAGLPAAVSLCVSRVPAVFLAVSTAWLQLRRVYAVGTFGADAARRIGQTLRRSRSSAPSLTNRRAFPFVVRDRRDACPAVETERSYAVARLRSVLTRRSGARARCGWCSCLCSSYPRPNSWRSW